jgi:hypothetical protein
MTKAKAKPKKTPAKKRIVRAVGRPSKFTPDVCNRILTAIRNGNTYEASAQYGGISYSLLREWIVQGEQDQAGEFLEFVEALKKAEAEAEVESVALIRRSAQEGQWQAAAWFLERRKPSEWGRKDRHEIGGINGEPIKHEVTKFEQAAQKIYGDNEE